MSLNWYQRYKIGDIKVIDEIDSLYYLIKYKAYKDEIQNVTKLFIENVNQNFKTIVCRLEEWGYPFKEVPITRPTLHTAEDILNIEKKAASEGFLIPQLYLEFSKKIGSVNFDYKYPLKIDQNKIKQLNMGIHLEPLTIYSIDQHPNYPNNLNQLGDDIYIREDNKHSKNNLKINFSEKYLYSITLKKQRAFSTNLCYPPIGEVNFSFIEYIRNCFRWGGFMGLENADYILPETLKFLKHLTMNLKSV